MALGLLALAMYISCIFHVVCVSFSALAMRKLADAKADYSGIWAERPVPTGRFFRGFAAESVVESADSIPESADSTTDFVIVGRLPVLNMFNISTPIKSPTLVGRLLPSADCKAV